jgi:hypothetical protein
MVGYTGAYACRAGLGVRAPAASVAAWRTDRAWMVGYRADGAAGLLLLLLLLLTWPLCGAAPGDTAPSDPCSHRSRRADERVGVAGAPALCVLRALCVLARRSVTRTGTRLTTPVAAYRSGTAAPSPHALGCMRPRLSVASVDGRKVRDAGPSMTACSRALATARGAATGPGSTAGDALPAGDRPGGGKAKKKRRKSCGLVSDTITTRAACARVCVGLTGSSGRAHVE